MRTTDIILIFILLIVLGLMGYTIYRLSLESAQCSINPIGFAYKKLQENYGNISCACSAGDKYFAITENGLEGITYGFD